MKMNSVVDGLRQTSKGRLVYNRKIEGRALTDLLKKCASVPALSSPHNEFIPEDPVRSASFGLGYGEDVDEEDTSHVSLHLDHQYTTSDDQCGCGEKGEQDLLQKENLPQGVSEGPVHSSLGPGQQGKGPHSPLSSDICHSPHAVSPQSPKYKHPQVESAGDSQDTRPNHFLAASPKRPQNPKSLQSPKSPQIVSPKCPQTLSPKQPVSPKSPISPHIASPISPHSVSPKSPRVSSPKSPSAWSYGMVYSIEEGSRPDAMVSAAPLEDKVDIGASESVPVTDHVQWMQNTSGDSESGLLETCDQEEEIDDTVHEDLRASFIEKMHVIVELEEDYDNKSREVLEEKQLEFLSHQTHLDAQQRELVSHMEQRHLDDISQLQDSIEKQQQSKRPEIQKAVQKVKETHQHCSHRQNTRLQQLEQLSQHLKEEKAKREQALEEKLQEVRAMAQKVTANKTMATNMLDQCPHKQHLSEVAEKTKLLVRKLSEQAESLAGGLTRSGPLDEVLTRLKQFHEQSQNALDFVHNLIAEAEKKAKAAAEAERQKQLAAQAALTQPPQAGQATPTSQGGQTASTPQAVAAGEEGALAVVAKEYEKNVKLLSQMDAAIDPFINDQQMKKIRFDLQRAVNTPVNAISPVSSEHLRDKLLRLRCLLKGDTVEVSGKQVSVHVVPQGLTFCKNLVAKMIVRKADEQVSSSHESAFAIAAVAVGLWTEFPEVGDLIMAHLQALCPYILPFYPPRLPNQSSEEYHKTLGYKIVDGNIEQQDKFLKRMSGILRLYAAIMVTSPPQGPHLPHPHGLEHAWVWLARSMNLQPNPDITATAIYDMLHVTGGFLLRAYRVQFVKLLYFLYKVFLPKLKDVAAGSGPVSRLETFLETTMKNSAQIPEPEGYLPPHFWR